MSMRKLATGCATTVVAALLVALPGSSAVAVKGDYKYCEYGTGAYVSKNKLISAKQGVAVTHLKTFSAPPKYSRVTTKKAGKRTVLRGSVKLNAEVSASLGNKIISKGEAKVGLQLVGAGSRTKTSSVKVTEKISNPSAQNATFVFFRGNKRAFGAWKRSYCQQVSGKVGEVKWQRGKWASFVTMDDGAVRCGAGKANLNAVARKAYDIGCA